MSTKDHNRQSQVVCVKLPVLYQTYLKLHIQVIELSNSNSHILGFQKAMFYLYYCHQIYKPTYNV